MILRLLAMPVIDVLILLLLARIFFPQFFGVKRRRTEDVKERIIMRDRKQESSGKERKGEYIEYEEIR